MKHNSLHEVMNLKPPSFKGLPASFENPINTGLKIWLVAINVGLLVHRQFPLFTPSLFGSLQAT